MNRNTEGKRYHSKPEAQRRNIVNIVVSTMNATVWHLQRPRSITETITLSQISSLIADNSHGDWNCERNDGLRFDLDRTTLHLSTVYKETDTRPGPDS